MPRPSDAKLAFYWDQKRLLVDTDEEADQLLVEYGCSRLRALDKERKNREAGIPPTIRYESRIDKTERLLAKVKKRKEQVE